MSSKRQYRPGSRYSRFRTGRMSENRAAWMRTVIGQFVMLVYPEREPIDEEGQEDDMKEVVDPAAGETVCLFIPIPRGRPINYNLSALTHEELVIMREFFNLLFDRAEPVTIMRDRMAQDAYDRGDDSFTRIYRQVPQFVVRGRTGGAYDEGIHDGPSNDAEGPVGGRGGAGQLRADGGELADDNPQEPESRDDEPQAD